MSQRSAANETIDHPKRPNEVLIGWRSILKAPLGMFHMMPVTEYSNAQPQAQAAKKSYQPKFLSIGFFLVAPQLRFKLKHRSTFR